MKRFILSGAFLLAQLGAKETHTPGHPIEGDFDAFSQDFIEYYCFDCHGDGVSKGDLSLEELGPPDETNLDLWKSIWAQVAVQQMPPKKKDQPEPLERVKFLDGVVNTLEYVMKDKGGFNEHKHPKKGNFVDHKLLFGTVPDTIKLEPTSSPKRIWRVTPSEHITRLNELINTEPEFNPEKPGLRAHGDAVSTNHGGELKLYFGVDRIINWSGGTVAYATAVKAVPVVLSPAHEHGFENYADFSSVNSAETIQILNKANHVLRYMAYGPKSLIKYPEQITDDPAEYWAAKGEENGDDRGMTSSITYSTEMTRPKTPLYELLKEPKEYYSDAELTVVIEHLYEMLTFRPPSPEESQRYVDLTQNSIKEVGPEQGLFLGLSALFLDRNALFRAELAKDGETDQYGRVMLQDWELGLALNQALSYIKPDETLRNAITEGKMRTKEDVKREITRMLADDSIRKPRVLQFFREYFDYDLAGKICKDITSLRKTGAKLGSEPMRKYMYISSASTDRLVELILAEDKNVLKELLTTQKVVLAKHDSIFYGSELIPKDPKVVTSQERPIPKARPKKNTKAVNQRVKKKKPLRTKKNSREIQKEIFNDSSLPMEERKATFRKFVNITTAFRKKKRTVQIPKRETNTMEFAEFKGEQINARVGYMSFGKSSLFPERLLSTAPEGQRMGILTQPAWLVSHSDAMDNHAIHRGIWIRKRLLGGGIPDVPITVDAQLPDEPNATLRHRMRVTREKYCWSCHEKMDPLGLPFEMYNHIGMYREHEQGQPVDTSGEIIDSGDPSLDGPVTNALDMISKLAESEHVEQVFVRHAFRYWMGRNETLHDGPTLQEAHKAYRDSGGSMNALITSLVTSDAFLYRK